jgi:hypothetical protein
MTTNNSEIVLNIGDAFYDKNYKKYVVIILDKEDEPQIVTKYYGKVKQYWHYEIEDLYSFNRRFRLGLYKLSRKDFD